jgi:hypothetical protein
MMVTTTIITTPTSTTTTTTTITKTIKGRKRLLGSIIRAAAEYKAVATNSYRCHTGYFGEFYGLTGGTMAGASS